MDKVGVTLEGNEPSPACDRKQFPNRPPVRFRPRAAAPEETDQTLRRVLSPACIGAALLDWGGRFRWANAALRRLLGLAAAARPARNPRALSRLRRAPQFRGLLRRLHAGRAKTGCVEFRCVGPDAARLHLRASLLAVGRGRGAPGSVLALFEDISASGAAPHRDAVLARLALQLSIATQLREAARFIHAAAADLLGWDAAHLHLLSDDGRLLPVLTVDTVRGQRVEVPETSASLDPTPLMLRVMRRGPWMLRRSRPGGRGVRPRPGPFGDTTRRPASMMCVPIKYGRRAVGMLCIQSDSPGAYAPRDVELLAKLSAEGADALQRIQARVALAEREQRFRTLVEALPDVLIRCRADGTILDFKPAAFCPCGCASAVWRGKPVSALLVRCCGLKPSDLKKLAAGHPQPRALHFRCSRRPATDIELRIARGADGERLFVLRDVTETMSLQRTILDISHRERRAVGHELHDVLGSHLGGTAFQARLLLDSLSSKAPSLRPAGLQLCWLINSAARITRTLAHSLDPVAPEHASLELALASLAREARTLFHIRCAFVSAPPRCHFEPSTVTHLYRIAQESIRNAVRHGRASAVRLECRLRGDEFQLRIRDNGRGFAARARSDVGMGLRLMRYRANLIGGRLSVTSRRGRGTTVRCVLSRSAPVHDARLPKRSEPGRPRPSLGTPPAHAPSAVKAPAPRRLRPPVRRPSGVQESST